MPKAKTKTLGEQLAEIRAERKLSLVQAGEATSLHMTAIHRFEKGSRTPNFESLDALARGYGVTFVFSPDGPYIEEDNSDGSA